MALVGYVQMKRAHDRRHDGLVEAGSKQIQGGSGMLRLSRESRYSISIDSGHIAWPWLVRHIVWALSRHQSGASRRSAPSPAQCGELPE